MSLARQGDIDLFCRAAIGQADDEIAAVAFFGFNGNASAEAIERALDDGEANAGPARIMGGVSAIEDVEDGGSIAFRNSYALIANVNFAMVFMVHGENLDDGRLAESGELESIDHKVGKDLGQ